MTQIVWLKKLKGDIPLIKSISTLTLQAVIEAQMLQMKTQQELAIEGAKAKQDMAIKDAEAKQKIAIDNAKAQQELIAKVKKLETELLIIQQKNQAKQGV